MAKVSKIILSSLMGALLFASSLSAVMCSSDCTPCSTDCSSPGPTDKTFLMPRDPGTNLAMDHTTWHSFRADKLEGKSAHLVVTGFYQSSENNENLGQYFGFEGRNGNALDYVGVSAADIPEQPLLPANVIHDVARSGDPFDPATQPLQDQLTLRPGQEVWGAKLLYHQCLSRWVKGLYFNVHAPLVYVKNTLGTCNDDCDTCELPAVTSRTQKLDGGTGTAVSFADYLAGNVEQTTDPNKQAQLCAAKIKCSESETALADLRFELGYDLYRKENMNMSIAGLVVFPTSNTPRGEYLFEAVAGNGNHWAVGGSLDAAMRKQWNDCKVELHLAAQYQYVFEDTERRTIGFKSRKGVLNSFGFYYLGGETGKNELFPLANVLTRRVDVTPGSKIDALAALTVDHGNFSVDVGYNVFWKEKEKVCVKCWDDNKYTIADFDFDTTNAFDATDPNVATNDGDAGQDTAIQAADLFPSTAATPEMLTHKLFGGVGYRFKDWSTPLMLGAGASYEWAGNRGALEGWSVWARVGFAI